LSDGVVMVIGSIVTCW